MYVYLTYTDACCQVLRENKLSSHTARFCEEVQETIATRLCEHFSFFLPFKIQTSPTPRWSSMSPNTSVADWLEDFLPAPGRVSPTVGLQNHGPLQTVGYHEAIHHVMYLTAIAAALVDVADQFLYLATVFWILKQKHKWSDQSLFNRVPRLLRLMVGEKEGALEPCLESCLEIFWQNFRSPAKRKLFKLVELW